MSKLDEVTATLRQRIVSSGIAIDELLPTESELAKQFGCSRGTVGKALDRLVQQGLVTRKTRVGTRVISQTPKTPVPSLNAFGFIHPSEQHEQIWDSIRGFSEAAEAAGRRTVAISYNNDHDKEFEILKHLGDFMLEGVAIYPVIQSSAMAIKLIETADSCGIPLVFVCLAAGGMEHPMVGIDGFDAGLNVTSNLINKGAKNIGFIGNNGWTLSGRDRLQGFRRALQQAGLPWHQEFVRQDYPTRANFTEPTQEGFEIGTEFLNQHPELDAIICTDVYLGTGCLRAMREAGRNVPSDFQVGILDYNSLCESPDANVTAYHIDHREIGRKAFQTLDTLVNGQSQNGVMMEVLQSGKLIECGQT